MAKKAGEIVINIRAGTTNLQSDLKKAESSFKSFGTHSVSGVQATSGALRLLEGNLTNNLRASERFLANTLKLGPALQAAFPIVGGLAFAGLLADLGGKVVDFFKTVKEGPAKAHDAFSALNQSIRVTNDGLALTGTRLKNEIMQLQGRPTNHLAEALAQAKEEADKLTESLTRTLKAEEDVMKEESGTYSGRIGQWLAGNAGTHDIQIELQSFRRNTQDMSGDRSSAYQAEIAKFQHQLAVAQAPNPGAPAHPTYSATWRAAAPGPKDFAGDQLSGDMTNRIADLKDVLHILKGDLDEIGQTKAVEGLEKTKASLEDLKQSADLTRPVLDKLKALQTELAGAQAKLAAVGDTAAYAVAQGMAKAGEDIEEVNRKLAKKGPQDQMNALQALQIIFTDVATAATEAEIRWQDTYQKGSAEIKDRIEALKLEGQALGGTYDQHKQAFIAQQLRQQLGPENYASYLAGTDTAQHHQQANVMAGQIGTQFSTQNANEGKQALLQLQDKIQLTNALAGAEHNGAEAVRQAELAERIRVATRGMDAAAATKLTAAMQAEYAAERREESEKELETLRLQASAMERLAAAYGYKAKMQAEADNAYAASMQKYGDPALATAARNASLQKSQDSSLESAKNSLPSEQLDHLSQMEAALNQIKATQGDCVELQNALKDIENQRLEIESQTLEKQDSIVDGMRAALDKMAATAQTVSSIVSEAMQSLIDKTSSLLADMLTGQKPKHTTWKQEFGGMFQQLGHQLIQQSIKSSLSRLAGAVAKRDGSSISSALYVQPVGGTGLGGTPTAKSGSGELIGTINHQIVDQQGNPVNPPAGVASDATTYAPAISQAMQPLAALGGKTGSAFADLSGAFGAVAQIGNAFHSAGLIGSGAAPSAPTGNGEAIGTLYNTPQGLPGMADGGDVYSGGLAMVGENGPEIASMPKGARITPLDKVGGTTNHHYEYTINAPGAQIGAETRIAAAIEAAHNEAVKNSVRAVHEQKWRTPQRTGKS